MPRANRQRVLFGQLHQVGVGAAAAHQAHTRGLAEGQPELNARHGAHQRLVHVFDGFDKVGLPQDKIHILWFFDLDAQQFHAIPPHANDSSLIVHWPGRLIAPTSGGNLR